MLSEPQLQRYSRQLLLPEIGGAGQERLLASRVEVLGEGAAAESLRDYLAAAGVGLGKGGLLVHAFPRGTSLDTLASQATRDERSSTPAHLAEHEQNDPFVPSSPRSGRIEGRPTWILSDVGVAWSHSRPCAACLAAALAEIPLPPGWAQPAVAQAAAALAASQILLSLVGRPPEAGLYLAWPRAERRTPTSRPGCDCA